MTFVFWIVVSCFFLLLALFMASMVVFHRRIEKLNRLGQHLHDKWIASLRKEQYLIEEIEDLTNIRDASLDCIERIRGPLDKKQEPVETNQDV